MDSLVYWVLASLGLVGLINLIYFTRDLVEHWQFLEDGSLVKLGLIGLVTNFLDVLGIGNFATVTVGLRASGQCEDRLIPGSLNVGLSLPMVLEAFIFIREVRLDPLTLIAMMLAAGLGSYVGSSIVSGLEERKIQLGMGICLIATVVFMLLGRLGIMPAGGEALGLTGGKLLVAVGLNFIIGGLTTLGIGFYAPCMALVYGLGMSPLVAFPIMFGSGAILMPVAAISFIKNAAYNRKVALVLTVSGIMGVLLGTNLVTGLDLEILSWLVIVVVSYNAVGILRKAGSEI